MGPITILDKSTFQSLSAAEHSQFGRYFMQNIPTVLVLEILADLSKTVHNSRLPKEIVRDLARKFGGSGTPVSMEYHEICVRELAGTSIPMDGVIIDSRESKSPDAAAGIILDPTDANWAIMRWSRGEFSKKEREIAADWRNLTTSFDLDAFSAQLDSAQVIIPAPSSIEELPRIIKQLIDAPGLQDVWLAWLLAQLKAAGQVTEDYVRMVDRRWALQPGRSLERFAPYSYFCIRVLLTLVASVRHRLIRHSATDIVDIQYLYYLPFCRVFSSNDRLHTKLAPGLITDEQSFVAGTDLKRDLARIAVEWKNMSESQKAKRNYAFGSHPAPRTGSVVSDLWRRHMNPWNTGSVNRASPLSDEVKREALEEAQRLFDSTDDSSSSEHDGTTRPPKKPNN